MTPTEPRPAVSLLRRERIEQIVAEAFQTLERVGVWVENAEAVDVLAGAGARVDDDRARVFLPQALVEKCVATVPGRFSLFDRDGDGEVVVGGDNLTFVPGSAAMTVLDSGTGRARAATTADVVDFIRVTDCLDAFAAQSTGVVPSDIPQQIADRYRLFLALVFGRKPVVTGTFVKDGFSAMHAMLAAVRGGAEGLRERPLAVFDCCPSPPLRWSDLTCQALMDCARTGVPAETVSMPLPGAASPVTLAGSLVQHTAESLSGIVIHQSVNPGAPIVYGGAPASFDMRTGTTPFGAAETWLMDVGAVEIARTLGVPSHAYMGLSDAKTIDYQAGMETAMGAMLAALCGVNVVAGAGMLDFVNCQSLEKLVTDAEACAAARRWRDGVAFREATAGFEVLAELAHAKDFLTSEHTRRFFRDETHYPSDVIDRANAGDWERAGALSTSARARRRVEHLLGEAPATSPQPGAVLEALEEIMNSDAAAHGVDTLPSWKEHLGR